MTLLPNHCVWGQGGRVCAARKATHSTVTGKEGTERGSRCSFVSKQAGQCHVSTAEPVDDGAFGGRGGGALSPGQADSGSVRFRVWLSRPGRVVALSLLG